MSESYVVRNDRERSRMRALIERLSDADLGRKVNDEWTVAAALGHIAFWDVRYLWVADKMERGLAFSESDAEPDDVSWINDSVRPFLDAIPPRELARIALRIAEQIDTRVASLPAEAMWPADPNSLLNADRAEHRREHLDEIEAALRR